MTLSLTGRANSSLFPCDGLETCPRVPCFHPKAVETGFSSHPDSDQEQGQNGGVIFNSMKLIFTHKTVFGFRSSESVTIENQCKYILQIYLTVL